MKTLARVLLAAGTVVASAVGCTTSLDAIGSGGGGAEPSFASSTVGTAAGSTVATSGPHAVPVAPCGVHYDVDSCFVADTTPALLSAADASSLLAGAWRRCDEDGPGAFPVGLKLFEDGGVYRMYRHDNEWDGLTETVVSCGTATNDAGTWTVSDAPGGGASPPVLSITWDDGSEDTFELLFFEQSSKLGLVYGADVGVGHFGPQAGLVPGTMP